MKPTRVGIYDGTTGRLKRSIAIDADGNLAEPYTHAAGERVYLMLQHEPTEEWRDPATLPGMRYVIGPLGPSEPT